MKLFIRIFLMGALAYSSCKKEYACLDCIAVNHPPADTTPALNRPPIANAGPDQAILFPATQATLDGSRSSDPEQNISGYLWTRISGRPSSHIVDTGTVKTQVTGLSEGIYYFELKVSDSGGLFSKDTVVITVPGLCPVIHVRLSPLGSLSEAREGMAVAYAGNLILFAGGSNADSSSNSARVDIYDISSNTWSIAELSTGRTNMAVAVIGNKIFFAGGYILAGVSARVDIYDATNNIWTKAELSEARALLTSAAAGDKIVFAGGFNPSFAVNGSDRVDIYDTSSNTWSVAKLSRARWGASATAVGNKIYIAGGEAPKDPGHAPGAIVNNIDIYDVVANTWTFSSLGETKGYMASIAVDGKIYWAGGVSSINFSSNGYNLSDKVEIWDTGTNSSLYMHLCGPLAGTDAIAYHKNNSILFFSGLGFGTPENEFGIYDIPSGTWSLGLIDQFITGSAIISVGNNMYLAGGEVNGVLSNQVWKLEYY